MPSYDELLALARTQGELINELRADMKMLVHEVIRLERHQMIGVNPDLIDREKT